MTTPVRTRLRQLAELATTPLLPADFLDLVAPLRARGDLRARVVAVQPETADATTLVLKPGGGWAGHTAGQYVRLGVEVAGVRHWRAYSLTSPPRPDGLLTITVKAIPDGLVSHHLQGVDTGTLVHLDQAAGEFILPVQAPAKVLFVTAGSGITPVMGMLRAAAGSLSDAVLVHSAPTRDDVIFGAELRALPGVRLIELHTDSDGMLDAGRLAELVPDWAERETWACGPTGLLDLLEAMPTERTLHTERFRPVVVTPGDGGTVTYGGVTTVEVDGATTLLAAGEGAGVLMPSGCRMGICFGCVLPLREGAVRDLRDGRLTVATPGDGVLVQTCISAAAGSCHLDLSRSTETR